MYFLCRYDVIPTVNNGSIAKYLAMNPSKLFRIESAVSTLPSFHVNVLFNDAVSC